MLYEFKFPDVGEGIAEGEIVMWHIHPNEVIKEDQLIVEVQTDKAVVEISSPVGGKVENLHFEEGDSVEVGSVIVSIETSDSGKASLEKDEFTESQESAKTQEIFETPAPFEAPAQEKGTKGKYLPLAVPSVRRLARELNVDLHKVKGSGKDGRITDQDVRNLLGNEQKEDKRESPSINNSIQQASVEIHGVDERVPLQGIRKKIAQSMMKSISSSAQCTVMDEVNLIELVSLKMKMAEDTKEKGIKLTFTPFIVRAVTLALQEFPYLNASLDVEAQEIVLKKDYNIGIAVDTPAGLVVPVIKQAHKKSLSKLAGELNLLTAKARDSKLQLDDFKEGTFTISNIGSTRAVQFGTPILNYPEVAILGINKIHKKPIIVEDQIVIGHVMGIGLTFDHQVIDGAMAANFLKRIMELLEKPHLLFLDL